MTEQELITAHPEAQQYIQAKAAGLPGAYDEFTKYMRSLSPDAQQALVEAYERVITDDFSW